MKKVIKSKAIEGTEFTSEAERLKYEQVQLLSADVTEYCNCKDGPEGRTVTEDFKRICERCGKIAK